jgi:hypothetical protein
MHAQIVKALIVLHGLDWELGIFHFDNIDFSSLITDSFPTRLT